MKLHVVTPIFNPWRYKSRVALYNNFVEYLRPFEERGEIELHTIEIAFGDRQFTVTDPHNCKHIQLRSKYELWLKECSLNIAIQHLPQDWEYVAWIDADVQFARPDWAREAIQLLQHYDFIQMFGEAVDLSPSYEILKVHTGFMKAYAEGKSFKQNYSNYHPGFAHCARRDALDNVGGLFDVSILGAGDRHMALSLIGRSQTSLPKGISSGYKETLSLWEERANRWIKGNVSYMEGVLLHYWHGKKVDRRYVDRWKILVKNGFDPETDVYKDTSGLYRLTERNIQLHYDIRNYFKARSEDSIDVD